VLGALKRVRKSVSLSISPSMVTPLINLPFLCSFRRIDDNCGIATVIHALNNFSKSAVTDLSYPVRAGKSLNSHVPIPEWMVCGASRFAPIHTSLEAVRSPSGPHQSERRQNLLSTCLVTSLIKTCP